MIFCDTVIKVKRLKTVSGNRRALIATATGEASIQPVAKEPNAIAEGQFGTLYVAYCEADLPVRSGDTVTDPNGTVYAVREVIPRTDVPLPHLELTLIKQTT